MVLFALEEKSIKWRNVGVAAGVLMIFASKSRMGLVGLVACTVGPRMMPLILRGWAWQDSKDNLIAKATGTFMSNGQFKLLESET